MLAWVVVAGCVGIVLFVLQSWVHGGQRALHGSASSLTACIQAILWLPIPVATEISMKLPLLSAYSYFVSLGTLGLLLQTLAHWLRMSQQAAADEAVNQRIPTSDRRFWELLHKSSAGFSGSLALSFANLLVGLWMLAFASTMIGGNSGSTLFVGLGILLLILAAIWLLEQVRQLVHSISHYKCPNVAVARFIAEWNGLANLVCVSLVVGWLGVHAWLL